MTKFVILERDEITPSLRGRFTEIEFGSNQAFLRVHSGNEEYLKGYKKYSIEDMYKIDFTETKYKLKSKIEELKTQSPFASKVLPDGRKLFRRKHGIKEIILANSSKDIILTVPYKQAKINKLEIIDANPLDRVDLIVKSPIDANVAAAYGMPANAPLNQFGSNVIVSSLLYSDKSDYDADVYSGFQIVITYKNDTSTDKEVGFNITYHEVV